MQGDYGPKDCSRGRIKKMSKNSLARLIVVAQTTDVEFSSMLTLTYPRIYPRSGDIVKADVGFLTTWFKKAFNWQYLWFLEFQSRGAPHIHVMLDNDGISPRLRAEVGLKWTHRTATSDWFQDYLNDSVDPDKTSAAIIRNMAAVACHPKTWELIESGEGARRYVTKYAAKQMQKSVPGRFSNVGRFWGCSQSVPKEGVTVDVTDDEVRQYLTDRGHQAADWEVIPKYIFNVPA